MVTNDAVENVYARFLAIVRVNENAAPTKIISIFTGSLREPLRYPNIRSDAAETIEIAEPLKSGCMRDTVCLIRILATSAADAAISRV